MVKIPDDPRLVTEKAILAAESIFDAIVSDVVMPEMTGIQRSAELERQRSGASAQIAFVTGAAMAVREVIRRNAAGPVQ
jgi:CheY-like chemotaxis protein